MEEDEIFEFNWHTEEHSVAEEAFASLAENMNSKDISVETYMEVLFVITLTYHLHHTDRGSLQRLVSEGMQAVPCNDCTPENALYH